MLGGGDFFNLIPSNQPVTTTSEVPASRTGRGSQSFGQAAVVRLVIDSTGTPNPVPIVHQHPTSPVATGGGGSNRHGLTRGPAGPLA